ncbi:F0F1 ATP synthase subunit B [Longispora sp. K20-0274]|uniref:F0F1 ATP synthase subunit B family protein n=1 Tax=Longispora sp. K20-0274 TaxID=3088255 RepID=UPI00399BF61D
MPLATNPVKDLLGPLYPEPVELLVGSVGFALLCFVLLRYVLPRADRIAEHRADVIEGGLTAAEHILAEAAGVRRERDLIIADARQEATQIRQHATAEASAERAALVAAAVEERDRALAEGRARLHRERDAVRQRMIDTDLPRIAAELASRVIGERLPESAAPR